MMDLRSRQRLLLAFLALVLGACAHMPLAPNAAPPPAPQTPGALGRYEVLREPNLVNELRAAPAPARAEIADSQSPAGDEHVLGAKGYVHIGDGYYAGVGEEAHAWLIARAAEVGADRVMIYGVNKDGAASLYAAYYVHFKLPFGASFRDLRADERDAVGAGGVKLGTVIGNSPAAQANLRAGDILLKFNGEAIHDRADFEQRLRAHMGKRVTFVVSRDGETLTRLVRLGVLAVEADTAR